MKKVKKILISIMIAIVAILGFYTKSNAYSYKIGDKIKIGTWYQGNDIQMLYNKSQDLFCLQHNQKLRNYGNDYTVISFVDIQGNKSTDYTGKTIENSANARLAYILSEDNPISNSSDQAKQMEVKNSGPVAIGIWRYMPTWMKQVGQYHAGLNSTFASEYDNAQAVWREQESANYANNLKMKDNTNKSNINVISYEKDGQQYMRVGPFNWSFPGNLTSVTAKDQNNRDIKISLFSSYNGNAQYWYSVDKIQSGKDFYISIPVSSGITKLTKLSATTNETVKGVKIWFLKPENEVWQNLILRERYTTNQNIEATFDYNVSILGNLKIIKVNENNQSVKLKDVGFYIKNKETNKYVRKNSNGNISYTDNKNEATEFLTDSNGEIKIDNLIVGTYIAYETKNPNYGYEINKDGQEIVVRVDKTTEKIIGNKQIYIKLSGYVWVDKIYGKTSIRNDLFKDNDYDSNDILLDGVTVRLKDRTTNQVVTDANGNKFETKTSNGGAYMFDNVLIQKLSDYYVEFEYDGLTYTNVIPHIDRDNGSKSAETEAERIAFNNGFSVVEGETRNTGFTRDDKGNRKNNLTYNVDEKKHETTLINNGQYTIDANTDATGFNIKDHLVYGQSEIKNINLGLYEREKPDISLVKDIQNVIVTVNGYEHTYTYAKRFENEGEYAGGFNVGVKFADKYGNMTYSRAVYESDYLYENEKDRSKELKVYVTYKIAMRNESSSLVTQVNSITDYFDNNYSIVAIGTKLNEQGKVAENNVKYEVNNYDSKYQKATITNNTRIEAQQEESVYVQFELNKEAVIKILNNKENLNNVAEINSYSIFDNDGKVYAGIDIDSNPGNCEPGNTMTYEDDTDSSPALKLDVADAREISGKVFLDATSQELKTGEIRQGNGQYDDGEKGIEGVEITFTENSGSGKVYTAKTDNNGDFLITGYIPGDYTLTYTWGDQTYTVQNYKGTVYDKNRDQSNKNWYKEDVNTRKTDAIDDYKTRLDIDNELKSIKNSTQTTINKMNSITPTMGIGVEYDTTTTASMGDKYTYRINNVDFGIVERARQDVGLIKRVKTMKVTLANGQVITNVTIDENGKVTGEKENLVYMSPSESTIPKNGFVKLELDNELIQGALLEVEYEIKAVNNSELDYVSEEYYKYGTQTGEVVTIKPTAIIDYLDDSWAFDSSKNSGWEAKKLDDVKDKLAEIVYNNENSEINERTILYTESLKDKSLKPNESADMMLNVSKTLANSDEISLDNETEIVELDKNGGSKTISTPGNYVPGAGKTEADDDMAETVIVTPNTGDNKDYTMLITLGISTLAILGAGVFIIKKKVLNK